MGKKKKSITTADNTSKKKITLEEVKKRKLEKRAMKDRKSHLFKFVGLDKVEYSITEQQKLFVEYYLTYGANGIDAVIAAGYDVTFKNKKSGDGGINRKLAYVIASENLVKPNVVAYVNLRLDEYGYNDSNVERQHNFLLNQNSDLGAKARAIDMMYKKRGEYAPEKVDVRHLLDEFDDTPDDDLAKASSLKKK